MIVGRGGRDTAIVTPLPAMLLQRHAATTATMMMMVVVMVMVMDQDEPRNESDYGADDDGQMILLRFKLAKSCNQEGAGEAFRNQRHRRHHDYAANTTIIASTITSMIIPTVFIPVKIFSP